MSTELKNHKKYTNFHNRSATFKTLMNNYKNKLKLSRDLNKEVILRQIYSKIAQIENNERENDFIISEVKRNAQINQEILYSFGTKALNHLNEVFKVNVTTKMDKSKFFGMNEGDNYKKVQKLKFKSETKHFIKNNTNYKNNKFILLPNIINQNNSNIFYKNDKKQNSQQKSKANNLTNMHIDIQKKRRKNDFEKFNYLSFRKEKISGYSIDSINNLTPISKKRNENSNDTMISVNIPLFTERIPKKFPKIEHEYIDYIRTMGDQFSESEKRQEKYFSKNKYGVDAFKIKYNFLKKKYFN